MTPDDEATFITLWQQGLETSVIAQRLGIPKGTVQSQAHRLQQRRLIHPGLGVGSIRVSTRSPGRRGHPRRHPHPRGCISSNGPYACRQP